MDRHEQRIVRLLLRPSAYPHPVGTVVRRETHVSHVFLAGAYAYKLKKPVRFPFLDASTLVQRKRFCQLELSLNRRLTRGVYLRIVPIVETDEGLRLGFESRRAGRIIEWVVQMRRLPEERMLDRLISTARISRRETAAVAERLVTFFRRAARSRRIDRYGHPAQVAELLLGNLKECRPFVGELLSEADRARIQAAYQQYLTLYEPLVWRRVRERRIIDGHGDLRCENICLPAPRRPAGQTGATSPVEVFDCVEFQPAFRCGDVANDLSFLLMDLEFRARADLAEVLATRYRRRVHDPTFDQVVSVYKCHRSLVRAKVRALAWRQHPRSVAGRRLRHLARRHFQLALGYLGQFAPPRLIVASGLIGTGKSTLARFLAEALGATWLRTDEIRLRGFGHVGRAGETFGKGRYAPHISQLVYQRLIRRAEELVRGGRSVVCDGTFSQSAGRQALREIAQRHGVSFHLFECVAPRPIALRRVARRYAAKADLSEAKPVHYARLEAGYEPIVGWPASAWTRLVTTRSPRQTPQAALRALRRAWLSSSSAHRSSQHHA